MAKSTRSKFKRSFRSKKRESGVYAATEAARLQRLNQNLRHAMGKDRDGDMKVDLVQENPEDLAHVASASNEPTLDADSMQVDSEPRLEHISTHGPRNSRREEWREWREWRKSKDVVPRPARHGMNRQGGVAAGRKAGRPSRRR